MKKSDIAWSAGIYEGEGSAGFRSNGKYQQISVQMTDLDILERLESLWGGKIYTSKLYKDYYKDAWTWRLYSRPAAEFLEKILPHLGNRRKARATQWLNSFYQSKLTKG